jgi:predicted alpha/beta hydrolase
MIYAYRVQAATVSLSTSLACALMSDVADRRGEQWVTALATFGCLPCTYYRVVCDKVVMGYAFVPTQLHTDMLRQWRCWHNRCRKIEWIAAAMQL